MRGPPPEQPERRLAGLVRLNVGVDQPTLLDGVEVGEHLRAGVAGQAEDVTDQFEAQNRVGIVPLVVDGLVGSGFGLAEHHLSIPELYAADA
jgi:hypothetical protein